MKQITIEQLELQGDIQEAIKWAYNQIDAYTPRPPKRPESLPQNVTSIQALNYSNKLQEFEELDQKYQEDFEAWEQYRDSTINLIELFIKKQADFNIVPLQSQNKVYNMAWERGHSSGYYGVYQELCELVELFNIQNLK